LLRINAILRRVPQAEPAVTTPKVLRLGPIRYDIERGEMWRGDDLVRLTSTESQLMRIFSGVPGEAVTRAKLVEELSRSGGQTQERAVDVQITRLLGRGGSQSACRSSCWCCLRRPFGHTKETGGMAPIR